MKNNQKPVYFISGLCFNPEILSLEYFSLFNIIPMSYHDIQFQSIDSLARILANKIPDNSAILAWSLGGLLAIKIAHSWPKKVSQLIFISSQPKFTNARGWKGIDQRQADLYLELSINNINDFYSRFKKLVNYPNKKSNIILGNRNIIKLRISL